MTDKRIGCYYCFNIFNPQDKQDSLQTFVKCSKCGRIYHKACWHIHKKCSYCEYDQVHPVNISQPSPLRPVSKIRPISIRPSVIHTLAGITTALHIDNLAELNVEKISAIVEDMHFVLKNHLDYYDRNEDISDKLVELSRKEHERLEEHLKQPFQVDLFCKELSRLSLNENIEKLLEMAQWVERIDQENPHSWFNDLELNAKLYAMLIVLLDGIDRVIIDEIYINAVQRLRENGVSNLLDPREIGLNDLLEKIRAQETELRLLHFNNKVFEEEVRRQIINHHHLLWSHIDMLLDWIYTYKAPEYWELRKAMGIAIGRLGIYYQHELLGVLESLAKHKHGGVVVAGYALDEICRTGEEYSFVTDVLEHWVKSGIPDLMWVAASSVWRIYDGLARAARTEGENTDEQAAKILENIEKLPIGTEDRSVNLWPV